MAAADVGDERAAFELRLDSLERRNPRRDQVRGVARAEEALGATEQVVVVLVPADARAAAESLGDLRLILRQRGGNVERSGHERWAALLRERKRLLGRKRETLAVRIVGDIATGGLV